MRQSNPYILLQTWEWTFLKTHNLLKKWPYFFFNLHPSEDAEDKGGHMVNERDFEAEKIKISNFAYMIQISKCQLLILTHF